MVNGSLHGPKHEPDEKAASTARDKDLLELYVEGITNGSGQHHQEDRSVLSDSDDDIYGLLTSHLRDYRPEDGGILDTWSDLYGESWMFITGFEAWYAWRDTHWERDECQQIQRQIEHLMDIMNQVARDNLSNAFAVLAAARSGKVNDDMDAAKREVEFWRQYVTATKRSKNKVSSVEGMAQARRAVAGGVLNGGNLLNLRNGTLDLDTLERRPHDPGDHLTYCLGYDYDPTAGCPRFERFLAEVLVKEGTTETDTELCTLFQEAMGYSLTNDTQYEAMFWLSGDGGNGKTVALQVLQKLLGPMSCLVDFQTIGLPGNYELAEVQGKRIVLSTESERGGKVAEGYLKRIVSGERINARPIYGSPFEFQSHAKVWWAMNDKPVIHDTSSALWRRLKLIPFNRTFTEKERDSTLLATLEGELSGILNYALVGLNRLRQRGRLPDSKAVTNELNEYRVESNPVEQWLTERTVKLDTPATLASNLHQDYQQWAEANGRQSMYSTNFGRELKRLKVTQRRSNRGVCYAVKVSDGTTPPDATV